MTDGENTTSSLCSHNNVHDCSTRSETLIGTCPSQTIFPLSLHQTCRSQNIQPKLDSSEMDWLRRQKRENATAIASTHESSPDHGNNTPILSRDATAVLSISTSLSHLKFPKYRLWRWPRRFDKTSNIFFRRFRNQQKTSNTTLPAPFRLLSLPPEIRRIIYFYAVLATRGQYPALSPGKPVFLSPAVGSQGYELKYGRFLHGATMCILLRVNRQILAEAEELVYGSGNFVLDWSGINYDRVSTMKYLNLLNGRARELMASIEQSIIVVAFLL